MNLTKSEDSRGKFSEIFKNHNNLNIAQISLVTINAGQTRGGHFHRELIESFVIVEGEMRVTLDTVSSTITANLNENNPAISIQPYTKHTVYSENGCTFMILASKIFNPDEPDTYR